MDRKKIYYVYEWYNVETGYIFYVGKGCKNRIYHVGKNSRNDYFVRYYNKHKCDCRKIKENLTEKQALDFEHERILELRKTNQCCCNLDDGGTNGGRNFGEKNGFYGKHHPPELMAQILEHRKGKFSGEKNSQYGISLKQRMKTKERYNRLRKNMSLAQRGNTNSPHISIIAIIDGEEIKFFSMSRCAKYLVENNISHYTLSTTYTKIKKAVKNNEKFLDIIFKLQ